MRSNVSGRNDGKSREELERREEEIRLKVESILDEEDEEIREEMILGLDEEELDALDEAMDEMEEDFDEDDEEDDEFLHEEYEESGKARLYEMAQPRHKCVVLSIPLHNNDEYSPLEITFLAKSPTVKGKVCRYIDIADGPDPTASDIISKQIYLSNGPDSTLSAHARSNENSEIFDFAKRVAEKYSNGHMQDMKDIINSIVLCYNKFVVDHNSLAEDKMPRDYFYVEWDDNKRKLVKSSLMT